MEYTLTMTFITDTGEKSNLSISGVKSDITNAEVVDLMDSIISTDVFESKKGSLVSKSAAQVTERQTVKFTV